MSKTKTDVATVAPTTSMVAPYDPNVARGQGRGNEDVKVDSLTIPRLKLLQKMSDEVDKFHASYIEGAEPGHFLNSLTDELHRGAIYVINVKFTESFAVWKKRELGGGLVRSCKSLSEAQEVLDLQDKPADFQLQHNHSHLLLLKDPATGALGKPVLMDFNSSKMSVSKNWNTMINTKGGDRFCGLWKLSPVNQTNKAGQIYLNLRVDFEGFALEDDYKAAEAVYEAFAS